jgi:hypothetical protein
MRLEENSTVIIPVPASGIAASSRISADWKSAKPKHLAFGDWFREGEMRLIAAALLAVLMSHPARAQEAANQAALDNAQAELTVCLSFYSILMDCASNEAEGRAAAEAALSRVAKMVMKASEAAHLRPSDVQLRFDLDLLDQRTFMGNSCSAVGSLRTRYASQCGEFLKDASE